MSSLTGSDDPSAVELREGQLVGVEQDRKAKWVGEVWLCNNPSLSDMEISGIKHAAPKLGAAVVELLKDGAEPGPGEFFFWECGQVLVQFFA